MSVLVFTENWDGNFKKLSFELVSYAAKVAEMTGTTAVSYTHLDVYKRQAHPVNHIVEY